MALSFVNVLLGSPGVVAGCVLLLQEGGKLLYGPFDQLAKAYGSVLQLVEIDRAGEIT
jgi:hypothetical protein